MESIKTSSAEDMSMTPVLGAGSQPGQTTVKQRQVGLVREVRKDGAVVKRCGDWIKLTNEVKFNSTAREDCGALV